MRKRRKSLLITLGVIVVFTVIFTTLLLYPDNLFAYRVTYKTFTLYANHPISSQRTIALDKAIQLASRSELYDSNFKYDIFLNEGTWYKAYTQYIFGPALARSLDNNILLNSYVDFERDILGESNKRNLIQTIAHEMVHCLQLHKYGMLSFNPINPPPVWKLEGYPEYIAFQEEIGRPDYDFRHTVNLLKSFVDSNQDWVELKPGFGDPLIYFKGRVLVEFLITKKGMTYDQILNNKIKENEVYQELLDWY